ncbi:MAG: hypothetical protein ACLQQ4_16765 [Bacteroidia bacterium]
MSYSLGGYAYFWTATEYSSGDAWFRGLYASNVQSKRGYAIKAYGFSVRCLQD